MLTVIGRDEESYITPKGEKKVKWICQCDCGKIKSIVAGSLTSGRTQACGHHKEAWNKGAKISESPTYDFQDTYVIGKLPTGEEFLFDIDDYGLISIHNWFITPNGYLKTGSAIGTHRFMHRLIMNAANGELVDHINRDKLDNRRCNLRICNYSQNGANSVRAGNINRGLYFDKRYNKWSVCITVNKIPRFLGYYSEYSDALQVRKTAEELYFGEYSYDNSVLIAKENEVKNLKNELYIPKS